MGFTPRRPTVNRHLRALVSLCAALSLAYLAVGAWAQIRPGARPGTRPAGPMTPGSPTAPTSPTAPGTGTAGARGFLPEGIDLLGGIDLSQAALVLGDINDLTGAVFDPESRQLVLVGQTNRKVPPFRLDDLAVALRSAQGLGGSPQGFETPGVSIEAPIINGMMTVRYLGDTEDTHFGAVMFEADRLMKCLALGKDNLTQQPLRPRVPGYKSELQLLHELGGTRRPNAWHRYWFRPSRIVVSQSLDGHSLKFEQVSVEVATEYVPPLAPGQSEPAAEAFARHMTENFAAYAQEYPVFQELLTLTKLQGLVNWLVQKRIPVDSTGLLLAPIPRISTPRTTPIGFAESEHQVPQGILKHQMRGGVDLRMVSRPGSGLLRQNWYVSSSPVVTEMGLSVLERRKKGATRWQVSVAGNPQTAVGLSSSVLARAVEGARKWAAEQQTAEADRSARG